MKALIQRACSWVLFGTIFFVFFAAKQGKSQTITLGSGTDINGITTSSPINIWFRKTVCYMVYTAAELTAAGATAGLITEMGFFVTNNPIYALPNYEIQMRHTTDPDAGGVITGGYTTVRTIASYAPSAGGWDMLTLDTPFDWDGVQNLVVRVCWSQVTPTFDPSGQVRVYTATDGYRFRRNDTGGSMCGFTPLTNLNTKPQLRLVFQNETEWTGSVSTSWSVPGNWTAGVPDETMDARIPTGVPNDPVLNSDGTCKSLTIDGNLSLNSGIQLNIYENLTNNGTISDLGGIVNFTGNGAQELSTASDLTLENLVVNTSDGVDLVSGNLVIGTELQVNKGTFETGDAVTFRSGPMGTARINELSTTCTYTLTMEDSWGDGWNGGFITLFEEGVERGTFSATSALTVATFEVVSGSTFTINYTSGSFENENTYTLTDDGGTDIFNDGPTPGTGDVFTDVASGCSFVSTIAGDITMERYIDAGETYWRYFASAVEDPTLAQYLDDFTTAGFPGSPFPDFPFTSIYSYDETLPPGDGYVPAASTAEVITVGKGYQVWSGDTITGTEPFLVDLTGPANQGNIDMPVTYTPSGTPTEDGWCLVGNPYASTIDWDSPFWIKTNMANATYIQNPDDRTYATYIAGAGANGGTRYIASQQSFWVQATAASPVLTAREGVKSSVDATFFKTGEIYSPGMNIQLTDGALRDEAVIRHIDGALDELEPAYDAAKVYGGWGTNPQITLMNTEAKDLTVHSFDKGFSEWSVPLRTIVFESGVYQLKFTNSFELDVPCLKLEDTYTGTFYDIDTEEETVLDFELSDTTYAPRFILHIGRDYDRMRENVTCHDFANGTYQLDLDIDEEVSYELTSGGEVIELGSGTGNPLELSGLSQGLYALTVDIDDFCATNMFNFSINEPAQIEAEAEVTAETFGSDGSIVLDVDGGTGDYTYWWSTGETSAAIYGLTGGTYFVTITDENECSRVYAYAVDSYLSLSGNDDDTEGLQVVYNHLDKQLNISDKEAFEGSALNLFTISGELITTYTLPSAANKATLNLPSDLSKGVYILRPVDNTWFYRFSY